jgi:deazaflavin-dependent oxidoreductase (nitroreductase family)
MSERGGIYVRWVLACVAAETIGMTASATAARLGQNITEDGAAAARWLALAVVVGGGLIEGVALGVLQARALAARWPGLSRLRFALVTVAVAGLGWAAASAPAILAGEDEGAAGPPLGFIVLGALGIGLLMGSVLGAAQAVPLRGVVAHPWRWVAANATAWPLVMTVIFVGASTAGAGWPLLAVAGYGAITGVVAGAALGLVSGAWLGTVDGQPLANRISLAMVHEQRFGIDRRLIGLAVTGRRTGRVLRFPVQYADHGDALVVLPGHPEKKVWWRNLTGAETRLEVLCGPDWLQATARVLLPGDNGHSAALAAYRRRWPRFEAPSGQPVVVIRPARSGIPAVSGRLESVG